MQGLAPMIIAGFSDKAGRRPAYILCFTIYLCANLGLALQNSYSALLGLRLMQSAGSSGTVALANALVGDTVTSADRGKYVAWASMGILLGPSLSPVIGGLLAQYLDWHWVFWFLLILGGVAFVPLFLFLPETCRNVVGDGSVPPPPLSWSLTDGIRERHRQKTGTAATPEEVAKVRNNYRLLLPNPWPTIKIALHLESFLILWASGLMMACFYALATGISNAFHELYGFNDIQVGLMFLPIGAGGIISTFTSGKAIDWNYRRYCKRLNFPIKKNVRQDLTNFPIEKTRLELVLPVYIIATISIIGYGWMIVYKVSLAGPVIMMLLIGWAFQAAMQVLNTIMVDLWPGNAAAATATINIFRCELGAAASAAIQPMTEAMGPGWAYTTLSLISLAFVPGFLFVMKYGMQRRQGKSKDSLSKEKGGL